MFLFLFVFIKHLLKYAGAAKFTFKVLFQLEFQRSASVLTDEEIAIPALLIKTSGNPKWSIVCSYNCCAPKLLERSWETVYVFFVRSGCSFFLFLL